MRLLDLFCGAGGAAMGYHQAGFTEIVGIDLYPQPNYPFTFIQADALQPPVDLSAFDLIHASPPCQVHSVATNRSNRQHLNLIPATRDLLTGRAYVMENVPGAPLRPDVMLCGSMFDLTTAEYELRRHRIFELSDHFGLMMTPPCNHVKKAPSVAGRIARETARTHSPARIDKVSLRAGYDDACALMGIDWMTPRNQGRELAQAIPPAYTRFLGQQFLAQVRT